MSRQADVIAGYFPVIHAGYIELLQTHPTADVAVFDDDILSGRFDYLRKDIRALKPPQAVEIIKGLNRNVRLIGETALEATMIQNDLAMPDDDVSRQIAAEFGTAPEFIPVFLRWDRENSTVSKSVEPDRIITLEHNDPVIAALLAGRERSTNWWRHVAAAIVKDNEILTIAHNSSVPTPYSSAIDCDPRITAKRGIGIETSIDIHAESRAIAELAKRGIATKDAAIFATTFPCPNCAKLIAESGITTCYYIEGYAMLDGQNILNVNGVKIIKIEPELPPEDPKKLHPYPSSRS